MQSTAPIDRFSELHVLSAVPQPHGFLLSHSTYLENPPKNLPEVMRFQQIMDEVVDEIYSRAVAIEEDNRPKFTKEDIKKVLEKKKVKKGPDFVLHLHEISRTPAEDAKKLYELLTSSESRVITKVVLGDCMVAFSLNKATYFEAIFRTICDRGDEFGRNNLGQGKKAIVDYSSPNIAKKFHVGHFRTTIIGKFVVNLLKECGYEVVSINYLGDWGKQFGYVLLGFEKYGDQEKLKADPLTHLCDLYVKVTAEAKEDPSIDVQAREIFRKMEEENDEKYMSLWKKFRELSIEKYKTLYSRLNIEFDVYSGESVYNVAAKEFVKGCGICTRDDDGSYVIDLGPSLKKALVQKSDGTTLYLTRDIVAAKDRIKSYGADMLVYVVASQQKHHFEQLFEIMRRLGHSETEFKHVSYGMITGMSTRNGNVHFIEDIIDTMTGEIKKRILNDSKKEIKDLEGTARNLAVSTLLISDFNAKREKCYKFEAEKRANWEVGSGAYLQYAHCRLLGIEENNSKVSDKELDFSILEKDEQVLDLSYMLLWYEYVVEECHEDLEPNQVFVYLKELARTVNKIIEDLNVMCAEDAATAAIRLFVLKASRVVINNALRLLGIVPLRKM